MAPWEVPRGLQHARLPALHLWRFSSRAALPGNRTDELSLRLDPGGRSCPTVHPGHVQPSNADPSPDGAGVNPRRPEILAASVRTSGATPCSAIETPLDDALSEQGG